MGVHNPDKKNCRGWVFSPILAICVCAVIQDLYWFSNSVVWNKVYKSLSLLFGLRQDT